MEIIKSNRGRFNLVYNNFVYNLRNRNDIRCYWRCSESKCSVTVITQDINIVKEPTEHFHDKHFKKIEKIKSRDQMIEEIKKSPNLSIKQIFNNVRENRTLKLIENNEDILIVPKFLNLKSSLYSKRKSTYPLIDKNNLIIPSDYQLTLDKKSFLIHNDNNMIVFSSSTFLTHLANSDRVYVDGTFSSVPRQFYQLFTIHILINNNMFPAAYALLPDKKMETYLRLLAIINQQIRLRLRLVFNPLHLHCDFECAIIKAFTSFFPSINVHGCYFHYSQCLYRKIQNLGLKICYEKNSEFRLLFKRCKALPLISLGDLDEAWFLINELNTNEDERVDEFLFYIQSTWVNENAIFKRDSWNHFGNFGTRTTNHLEGFHNKLNSCFNHGSPNLFSLINQLRSFELEFRIDLTHVLNGEKVHQKNNKYIKINENYMKYHHLYTNNQIDLLNYIDSVSRIM
ncbi:uncharacterized protein LOC128392104 [Panonychus citri]|uniref:uncharacterized protein LOC128392104 n=1 Tax=Panonychus citri TaxID=50023 RepID=UPI002307237C|nr:uncharacterized protein LOC128392104 [Panonychus citri]